MSTLLQPLLPLLLACGPLSSSSELPYRQVAAPATDILSGRLRLPDPTEQCTLSGCSWTRITLAPSEGSFAWEGDLPVGVAGPLALALIGEDALGWRLALGPGRELFALAHWLARPGTTHSAGFDEGTQAQRLELTAERGGSWHVRIEADRPSSGWIALRDNGRARLASHVSTWSTLAGEPVALVAELRDAAGLPLPASLERAELVLDLGGAELREPMLDDGAHADGDAGDGRYGAWLAPSLSGELRARVEMAGITSEGGPFLRTTHHRLRLLERELVLEGRARTEVQDELRTRIALPVTLLAEPRELLVGAELWGQDARGRALPVCWLGRLELPRQTSSGTTLELALDARWIDLSGARAPYELRNLRVQDPGHHVLLAECERLPLGQLPLPPRGWETPSAPTFAMLAAPALSGQSLPPPSGIPPRPTARALLLSHGHCSGGSIWPAADFTQPKREFLDPNADRTNDEFARLMLAQTQDLGSFGVVGHSQGGLAALQLYAYYVSGLDYAQGPRLIQSVASPYQGTPLADFSAGCGTHNDLSTSEAAAWLATIPSWARAEVYYYTVSNSGSACNFFTDFLLANPDDGVIEMARGQLPGGNAMGHTTGWCHTTGMTDPACYQDHARNAVLDANAAR